MTTPTMRENASEVACPDCGRHVMADPQPATGFIANCGYRLTRMDECVEGGCFTAMIDAALGERLEAAPPKP